MPDLGKTRSGFSFFAKLGIRTLFLSKHPDFNRLTGHFFLSYLMPAQQFAYDYSQIKGEKEVRRWKQV